MECSNPGQIKLARTLGLCMMQAVRAWLTAGRGGLAAAWAFLAAVALFGCAGGQSGAEDFCSDGQRDRSDTGNPFASESADEDGGVEGEDGSVPNELVADDGPEVQSGPEQCPPPIEGEEY
jgi:hypothetical protein